MITRLLVGFLVIFHAETSYAQTNVSVEAANVEIAGERLTVNDWINEPDIEEDWIDYIKIDTLIDKKSGVRFILDKSRTTVTAVCSDGKTLWETKPAEDNNLPIYRKSHRYIIYFNIHNYYITISYNNSQSGYLNPDNGKFHFAGQD